MQPAAPLARRGVSSGIVEREAASMSPDRPLPVRPIVEFSESQLVEQRGVIERLRVRRRTLIKFGLFTVAGSLLAACGGDDDDDDAAEPTANLQPVQPTNVPQPTVQTGGATAVATTAPAAAGETPTAGAEFQTIGSLTLRTEPYPEYDGEPVDSDLVTFARSEDLTDLTPTALNVYGPFTWLYDPPIFINEFSIEPEPWIATQWEVSSDGRTYTLNLRDDITFHDGDPLTAEDIVFSFIVYRDDPDSSVARFFVLMGQDPVAKDDHTLEVTLDSTSGDFIANTCNQFILQKKQFNEYWETNQTITGYDFGENPIIGTGAWKMTGYQPDEGVLEMERNTEYFHEVPHFERFIFRHIDSAPNRILAWKNNEIDLLWPITATDIDQVKDDEAWLYSSYAVAFMNAWINFENPNVDVADKLAPKKVRQALMHAVDRDGYTEAIFQGFVDQNAYGSIAFPWAYKADVVHYEYDPDKALALLAEEGWTMDGDSLVNAEGQPFTLAAMTSNQNNYPVDKIGESVQEDFRQIGIDMQLDKMEPAALRDRWRVSRDFDLYFVSRILFAGFSDYNYYHSSFRTSINEQGRNSGWNSPEGDELLDQIIREPDLEKQKDLLHSFQDLIADDLPALWFGFPRDLILVRKNINGYQPNSMWQFWNTWSLWRTE
jgi:peptide/nickel transport system substrate-binding protein